MIKVLSIAEPWDYTSNDGNNTMVIKTLYKRNGNSIAKILSSTNYDYDHIILLKRDKLSNYNIWSYDIKNDKTIKFVAIGNFFSFIDSIKYIFKYMLK